MTSRRHQSHRPDQHRRMPRAGALLIALLSALLLAGTGTITAQAVQAQPAGPAVAAALGAGIVPAAASADGDFVPTVYGEFDPGFIISDANFYDSRAMSEAEIQLFLEQQDCVAKDGVSCLADFTQTTTSQKAEGGQHCAAYTGARSEPASRIIAKVAVACGISPRALLVLLQKEQSLLTRPSEHGYTRAMGYGCPDTADCDTEYFGFFNQVFNAAWQMRQYTEQPERQYKVGTVEVGYHPDAGCGSSAVDIRNQATANLYNYTPYQPNRAATSDLAGEGDGCSTHGNLNFWLLYSKWFGDPQTVPFPAIFGACTNLVGGHGCGVPRWPLAPLPAEFSTE
ncbi:hypothetical protein [Microterricola pindariensis]|nr:hypothetical protein [Microterricola pindariensis]